MIRKTLGIILLIILIGSVAFLGVIDKKPIQYDENNTSHMYQSFRTITEGESNVDTYIRNSGLFTSIKWVRNISAIGIIIVGATIFIDKRRKY
ncbi:hypothetical protein [Alkaliphilus sp. B6464]|uniref:hypothetical protein n=1 Tax=Alkaliphilus sp. B6464 TaxID=2731219 RepID=UPI001BA8E42B|nr:hypothetical protein [Alkaliphilus sp. B6464]QUH22216.1 hypothetical protein HYG84_20120 [Alkaliphilus sp. B6464]